MNGGIALATIECSAPYSTNDWLSKSLPLGTEEAFAVNNPLPYLKVNQARTRGKEKERYGIAEVLHVIVEGEVKTR